MSDFDFRFGGLRAKYDVQKTDGSPVDPNAVYFTLRIDTDPFAREAVRAYAEEIQLVNPTLSADLQSALRKIEQHRPDCHRCESIYRIMGEKLVSCTNVKAVATGCVTVLKPGPDGGWPHRFDPVWVSHCNAFVPAKPEE